MDYLAILQAVVKYGAEIKAVIDVASTNHDVVTKIKEMSAPLASVFSTIGAQFFPKVAKEFHVAAVVGAAFDPNVTKWIQGATNNLLDPSPGLAVDGLYGPRTRAAVELLQTKLGLTVDGWAGQITQAAIAKLVSSGN